MARIYFLAQLVITWLGDSDGDDYLTFGPQLDLAGYMTESSRGALINFVRKPYWSRVWVIEELVLAKEVDTWCGTYYISSTELNTRVEE